jgi:hypothetical protein
MSNNKSVSVLTAREALALAMGKGKMTAGQYDRVKATVATAGMTEALVAYAVSVRGLTTVEKGTASLTALAKDTLREGQNVEARRSALSKLASAVGRVIASGVEMTPETFEAIRVAGDSTAEGRKYLDGAIARASKDADKVAALAYVLDAAGKARASKAAARKASEAGKGGKGGKANDGKPVAPAVPLTWAQSLAILAATAPGEANALDADALALASGYAASIADALADANATVQAALATARSKRK